MSRLRRALRRATTVPGVPRARRIAEHVVAPQLRADVHALGIDHGSTVARIASLERRLDALGLEQHMPAVLNAVSSTNGTARLLRRDVAALESVVDAMAAEIEVDRRSSMESLGSVQQTAEKAHESIEEVYRHLKRIEQAVADADANILGEMGPHIEMIGWLLRRVEFVRAEALNEIRYGGGKQEHVPVEILNPAALHPDDGSLRVNLGAGHIALPGFINVDLRELPGIDVVAPVDSLPFEPDTLDEIFSAHTLEHFPEEELRRKLLPYWHSLLRPGGTIRAVVPDLEAMTKAYTKGKVTFDVLRNVTYGGQEYEGDFHFTGFSPTSLSALFSACGFVEPEVIASGRPNGDCLECEVMAHRQLV